MQKWAGPIATRQIWMALHFPAMSDSDSVCSEPSKNGFKRFWYAAWSNWNSVFIYQFFHFPGIRQEKFLEEFLDIEPFLRKTKPKYIKWQKAWNNCIKVFYRLISDLRCSCLWNAGMNHSCHDVVHCIKPIEMQVTEKVFVFWCLIFVLKIRNPFCCCCGWQCLLKELSSKQSIQQPVHCRIVCKQVSKSQ